MNDTVTKKYLGTRPLVMTPITCPEHRDQFALEDKLPGAVVYACGCYWELANDPATEAMAAKGYWLSPEGSVTATHVTPLVLAHKIHATNSLGKSYLSEIPRFCPQHALGHHHLDPGKSVYWCGCYYELNEIPTAAIPEPEDELTLEEEQDYVGGLDQESADRPEGDELLLEEAMVYKPTLLERLWRRLGYRYAYAEMPEEWEQAVPYPRLQELYIKFGWDDRLRILFSGWVHIQRRFIDTIDDTEEVLDIACLPPGHQQPGMIKLEKK